MRKLGNIQFSCLKDLKLHKGWDYGRGASWVWDTVYGTMRIMDTLVKRGMAVHHKDERIYKITNAGVDVLAKLARGIEYEDIG